MVQFAQNNFDKIVNTSIKNDKHHAKSLVFDDVREHVYTKVYPRRSTGLNAFITGEIFDMVSVLSRKPSSLYSDVADVERLFYHRLNDVENAAIASNAFAAITPSHEGNVIYLVVDDVATEDIDMYDDGDVSPSSQAIGDEHDENNDDDDGDDNDDPTSHDISEGENKKQKKRKADDVYEDARDGDDILYHKEEENRHKKTRKTKKQSLHATMKENNSTLKRTLDATETASENGPNKRRKIIYERKNKRKMIDQSTATKEYVTYEDQDAARGKKQKQ